MRQTAPITLTGRTYDDIPGAETLFRLRGYEETRRFCMMSASLSAPIPDAPIPPGITLRTFRSTDLSALVDADNAIFAGHWESIPRFPPAWKRDLIDTRPHDPSLWILAWDGDRVVGECLSHLSREGGPEDAWIAIVGVREDWRGRGLGRAVLARGLKALQQVGYKTASLHVDGVNAPAIGLYRAMGMEITRTRLHFAKKLHP